MKKYELLKQPIHAGEVYNNGGSLYLVMGWNDDCITPAVHLRRIKDGWELDARCPALYLTDRGMELIWGWSANGHFVPMEDIG